MSGGLGSLVDDLCEEQGIVRSRAGLFPRSSEIKPLFRGSVYIYIIIFNIIIIIIFIYLFIIIIITFFFFFKF